MYSRRLTSMLLEESCGTKKPHKLMDGGSTINVNKPNIKASKYVEEAVNQSLPGLVKKLTPSARPIQPKPSIPSIDNGKNGTYTPPVGGPKLGDKPSMKMESTVFEEAVHANHPRLAKGGNYFGSLVGKVFGKNFGSNAKSRIDLANKIKTLRKERDFLRTPREGDTKVQKFIQGGLANHYDNHSRLLSKLGDPLLTTAVPKNLDNLPATPRLVTAAKK